MIDKKLLFVIPIYYRSLEDHGKEYTKKYEVFRKNKIKAWGKQFKEEYKNPLKLDLEFQRNWFSWDYTQIVHYVEIYKENNMLKSYLHSAIGQRYRPIMKNKVFKYIGKIADVAFIDDKYCNDEIVSSIESFISQLRIQFKNNYVDSKQLENILPYINFQKMTTKS